jgi:1,4-alpha-glucan branching enzyme
LNSDSEHYGGHGEGNLGGVDTEPVPSDGHESSLVLTLPALSALFFTPM